MPPSKKRISTPHHLGREAVTSREKLSAKNKEMALKEFEEVKSASSHARSNSWFNMNSSSTRMQYNTNK